MRRPYIPHASFNEHKDITTGIAWRGSPDVLLSTSKVRTLLYTTLNFYTFYLMFNNSIGSTGFVPHSACVCGRRETDGEGKSRLRRLQSDVWQPDACRY